MTMHIHNQQPSWHPGDPAHRRNMLVWHIGIFRSTYMPDAQQLDDLPFSPRL
jgi:hypothetical protein